MEDVRFRITPSAKSAKLSPTEQAAMKLLFDEVGDGYQSVSLADVQRFCKESPAIAREAMRRWQDVLSDEVRTQRLFDSKSRKAARWLYGAGATFGAFGAIEFVGSGNVAMAGALLATGAVVAAIGYCTPRRTPRGVELANRAEAQLAEGPSQETAPWESAIANAFGDALVA